MPSLDPRRVLLPVLALPLAASLLCAVIWSLHWPLVGDASLMHYVVFLMSRGLNPYKDIIDINLPGTSLFEGIAMHALGGGAFAWRIYDLLLLGFVAAGTVAISRQHKAAGALAAAIFALIHIQDGIAQLGQRDLLVAGFLLAGYAMIFSAQRPPANARGWKIFSAFLLMGLTFTIKPTFLPLGLLLLVLSSRHMRKAGVRTSAHLSIGLAGLALPSMFAAAWLYHLGALAAFRNTATTLIPFHAELGRKPLSFLLIHSTAPISIVCVCWLLLLVAVRPALSLERVELLAGIVVAFLGYVAQGKGYAYHRYPLLALLLVVMEQDFMAALELRVIPQVSAGALLIFQCAFFAPHAAWQVSTFSTLTPFQDGLTEELSKLGPDLSGQIQCLDTFGGCINTLYDLRLQQSSGYLYDCYLFTPKQNAVSARYREDFWQSWVARRPRVVVVTDQFCFGDSGGFSKLDSWPLLANDLASNYRLEDDWQTSVPQHWWSRSEPTPRFRIYARKVE